MGLGDNVVLRLMGCSTLTVSFDLFMDNYFTSFCLLTHIGVNNIRVRGTKISYANTLSSVTNSCKKWECSHFEQRNAYQSKMLCNLYGWLEQQQGTLHSLF